MTKHPVALAIALALTTSAILPGCDHTSNLTEQEHIQRAKDAEDKGNLKQGIIELKNAIQKNPDSAQARQLLGQLYLRLGKGEEAEKELLRAEKLGVSPELIKLDLGKAWLLMGEHQRLLDAITPTASTSARNKAAFLQMRGDALLGLRKLEEGCNQYKDSLLAEPKHVPAYWGLANCALAKADLAGARDMVDKALKIDNTNTESYLVLGDLERLSDSPAGAIDAYSKALKHDPANHAAWFRRGQLHVSIGEIKKASADLDGLKKVAPQHYGVPFLEGLLQYAEGKTDLALESVQASLKINPGYLHSQLLFALVQYDRKSYEQAVKTLSQYLTKAPGHLAARKLLAATYLKLNQPEQTLDLLTPYISAGKADAQVLALAGEARLREDDPSAAMDLFEKASGLVPTSAMLRTRLGMSQLAAGEDAEAVKELQAAASLGKTAPKADIALAYHFLAEKQFDKALAAIAALEIKLPDSPGTYSLKGMAYAGKGDYQRARENFEHALKLKPNLVSAAIRLASIDIRDKNIPAARGRYESILKLDKTNTPAMVGMAELAALEKKDKEYLDWLEKAAKASPSALVPRAYLADYYLARKQPQKALAIAREAVTGAAGNPLALALLGKMQLAAGEKQNALATFTKLAAAQPKSADAQYSLAQAYAALGDPNATRSALRNVLELKPDYIEALATFSKLETRTGNHAEAVRLAREVQTLSAKSPLGFDLEGDALMAQKRYAEAAATYEKALANGKDSRLIAKRHQALLRSGDAKKADSTILGWLEQNPQDLISRAYLAENYMLRRLNQQAIAQYQSLQNAVPNNPVVLNNLAVLYQKEKDPRALAVAEKAYAVDPEKADYADTLGWILVEQGKSAKGLELLEKAAKLDPKNPEVRVHLAYALTQTGQTKRARQEIARAKEMKLSPEQERLVQQLLQRIP